MKFGFDWPSGFREKISLKMVVINMYIAPGHGQTTPGGQIFSLTHLFSQLSSLLKNPQ